MGCTTRSEQMAFGTHVGYVLAANVFASVLGLVSLPILTKSLGASLYGIWSLLAVTVSLVSPFALLGLGMGLVRFLAAEKDKVIVRDDFLSACVLVMVTGSALSLLLYASSGYLGEVVFRNADAPYFLQLGSALVLLNSFHALPLAFFRLRRRMGVHALLTALHQGLVTGAMILAIVLGYRLEGVIVASVAAQTVSNLVSLELVVRRIGLERPSFRNLGRYLRWGVPLTPNAAVMWVIHASDRYMVSYFLGVAATGVYGAAYALGHCASFFLMPVQVVLYPNLVKTYAEGRHEETAEYLRRSTKYVMMLGIPSAVGLSVLGEPLLRILTTSEFLDGAQVIPLVAAGMVLFCFFQLMVGILHITDNTHLTVRLLFISAILNICLNLVLIPTVGILGAAFATLVAYGVLGLMTIVVTRRYLRFDLGFVFIAKSVAASAVMALCLYLIAPVSIPGVLLSIVAGAAVYFAVLIALKGLTRVEIVIFVSLVRGFLGNPRG